MKIEKPKSGRQSKRERESERREGGRLEIIEVV